ncbi:hypothetical protein GCM10011497_17740 [Elstera cyanobacteriorum]|nr:hypothetical protein GCM10011497_17740 [Elstera cyanobacteriorum]
MDGRFKPGEGIFNPVNRLRVSTVRHRHSPYSLTYTPAGDKVIDAPPWVAMVPPIYGSASIGPPRVPAERKYNHDQ